MELRYRNLYFTSYTIFTYILELRYKYPDLMDVDVLDLLHICCSLGSSKRSKCPEEERVQPNWIQSWVMDFILGIHSYVSFNKFRLFTHKSMEVQILLVHIEFSPNFAPPLIIARPSFWYREIYYDILKFYIFLA